jgi:hypothetical protein
MELIEEKIQLIAKEILEAGASEWTITKIIKALTEMNTTSEKKLREKTFEMLKELDENAAAIYDRFSKMKVYSSSEKIVRFNRGNIITSLLKETSISRSVAEKITIEVENQIKDSKISFLTPALIRELVNAKLLTYGFEQVRGNYTRVGEPVFEVRKKLDEAPYFGEGVREFNIMLQLPETAREMHFDGTIHIEDTEGFSHRPYAYSLIAEKKDTLDETLFKITKDSLDARKYFFITPSIYGITFACAEFAKNEKQAKEISVKIKLLLKLLDNPAISLELFTPEALMDLNEQRVNATKISNYLLSENSIVSVDSKYSLKMIKPEGHEFMVLNNSNEEYYPLSKQLFSSTRGMSLFVNVNLEKIAEGNDEENFFERLREVAGEINKLKQKKKEFLLAKKYLAGFNVNEMKTGIGFTNFYKLTENFPGAKTNEFLSKLFKELSKLFEEDLLFGLASSKAKEKFSEAMGKEIYSQETLEFEECLSSKKCCFTGKAGTIKELNELLDKKVKHVEYMGL